MKTALITGITGQDGSYLAELLLDKGYEVHGVIRRSSSFNTGRIDHVMDRIKLYHGDLTDAGSICRIVQQVQPEEVYNLGAQSHVRVSFDMPVYTYETIVLGTLNVLEAVRQFSPNSKVYQASSSEMFGSSPGPQNEDTPFRPRSPYGCAKVAAFHQVVNYREAFGMFAVNGILFNHESPRRGETFVTRKITKAAARIAAGLQYKLHLGNLSACRDWGFAGDYVEAMWLMLQQDDPQDFVIGTGLSHSVERFLHRVFFMAGINVEDHVEFDPRLLRPAEVDYLRADSAKARDVLKWTPKTTLEELAELMLDADREALCSTCGR